TAGAPSRSYLALPQGRAGYLSGAGVADSTSSEMETLLDASYLSGYGPVTASTGPDQATYSINFPSETAILGPIAVDLWASTTATDTDFFVTLVDEGPGGEISTLQVGM